jgi:mono/diheme cytochrome c family protein
MKTVSKLIIVTLISAFPFLLWSQNAQDTAWIFKSRCGSCHGSKGEGATAGKVPPIKGIAMPEAKFVAFIMKGEGGKTVHTTPMVNITEEQAKALFTYAKNLK